MTDLFSTVQWQLPNEVSLSPLELNWVTHLGSLTQRLTHLGELTVCRLNESDAILDHQAAIFLTLSDQSPCFLREVTLNLNGTPVVYARSLLPLSSLQGNNARLTAMQDTPLGSELFKAPSAKRLQLQIGYIPTNALPASICQPSTEPLIARRSILIKHQQPLLIAECFLPQLWPLAQHTSN